MSILLHKLPSKTKLFLHALTFAGGNDLRIIESGAFDTLRQLTKILLYDNNIADLPKRIFQHNLKTYKIDLQSNYLEDIPDLSGITDLQLCI